jgi:hypothetical protein
VCLEPQRDTLQQQVGGRFVRLGQQRALRLPQAPEQLTAVRGHQPHRIGEPGGSRRGELEVEPGQVLPRPARLGQHGGHPESP